MNRIKKMLALLLALCVVVLAVPAVAEEAMPGADIAPETVMATVAGREITMADVNNSVEYIISYYANYYGYDVSGADMREQVISVALAMLVQETVIDMKAEELGLKELPEERVAEITEQVNDSWENMIAYIMESEGITDESTDEEKAQARVEAIAAMEGFGYTLESMLEEELSNARTELVSDYMMAGAEVTEDEIQAAYAEAVDYDKSYFEGNPVMYEYYVNQGYDITYVPEGLRAVTQILLPADADKLSDYQTKKAQLDEQLATETDLGYGVTQEIVDEAYDAVMADILPVYDEIAEKFAAGTPFDEMIDEYNTDPGMSDPSYRANGYIVADGSDSYDPQFVAAVFSLNNVGEMSQPYLGTYGAYVVFYLRDVPAGPVEMTDELRATLEEQVLSEKQEVLYDETLDRWMAEFDIQYSEAALPFLGIEE